MVLMLFSLQYLQKLKYVQNYLKITSSLLWMAPTTHRRMKKVHSKS